MSRVVIAEDEALLVDVLTEVFEDEGFEVIAFTTADAAWSHLQAQPNPPGLLFTDVKMPGRMDGWMAWRWRSLLNDQRSLSSSAPVMPRSLTSDLNGPCFSPSIGHSNV